MMLLIDLLGLDIDIVLSQLQKIEKQNIHLDLTKLWLYLLNKARKFTENNDNIAFCYVDINYY